MKCTIAYIDDDEIDALIFQKIAQKDDWKIRHFSCPETFLKKAIIEEYDVVITDWMMPIMSGLDLCKVLKNDFPNLPIIICSSMSDNNWVNYALKFADEYLYKPIISEQLVSIINKLISK